ncbi:MAG: DNA translocase FtsK [Chloroflexi bacterium]|nr:DNA translocase FtsK [Chloroflexota bacterium]
MERKILNFQADKIEMVFAAHKAPVRVWGGRMTARTVQFHISPATNTKLAKIESLTDEIALALGVSNARVTRNQGTLSVEIERADSKQVWLTDLKTRLGADEALRHALAQPGTTILGLDAEGVPLLLRLASPDVAHCLIAGTTGSGKTELTRTMLASMVLHQKPRDLQLALFDPKYHGLALFAEMPHLLFNIIDNPDEMQVRLAYLVAEMERRDRDQITRPRIIVVIDELADALQTGGAAVEGLLTRLIQRGRGAGISLIACTQKPTVRAVGSLMKANFPVRIVGRVASAEDARVAAGISGSGAEKLAGRGDFLLIAGGQTIRFQAAQVRAPEIEQLIRARAGANASAIQGGWSGILRRIK